MNTDFFAFDETHQLGGSYYWDRGRDVRDPIAEFRMMGGGRQAAPAPILFGFGSSGSGGIPSKRDVVIQIVKASALGRHRFLGGGRAGGR